MKLLIGAKMSDNCNDSGCWELAGTTPEPIRKCQAKHAPLLANSRAHSNVSAKKDTICVNRPNPEKPFSSVSANTSP